MSAIERIERRLLGEEEWGDMAAPDVRISRREFEAALAEAWTGGAKFILDDQQLCDPNDPFMEAVLDGRNPWRKS
jgi:ribulose 1,5-bisphosphate carboxylase large subunit-like protein